MSWQEISTKEQYARKRHRCLWCPEPILPGTHYVRNVGTFEGDFNSNAYHLDCWKVSKDDPHLEEGIEPGAHKRGSLEPIDAKYLAQVRAADGKEGA